MARAATRPPWARAAVVRQDPALPELPEQFRVFQARPRLGLDLFELELVAEVGAALVDRFSVPAEPGGGLLRRDQAGQHQVGEGKQHPRFGVHYEQFFLRAEGSHVSIVRQDPPKRPGTSAHAPVRSGPGR